MSGSRSPGEHGSGVVELHRGRRAATVALVLLVGAGLIALGLRAGRADDGAGGRGTEELAADDAPPVITPPDVPTLEGSLVFLSDGALSVPEMSIEIGLASLFGSGVPPSDVLTVGSVAMVWRADGGGPIVAVDLAADDPEPVSVAPAGRLLASSVPGRFWLVQSKNETITVTEYDAGGVTVAETLVPGDPLADSGRGLVIRRDDQLSVWNPSSGEVGPVGPATPFVAAAGGRVVRCPDRCNLIQLVGGPTSDAESVIEMPGDIDLSGADGAGVIDADARRLAVAVHTAGRPHAAVVDLDSGTIDTFRLPAGDVQELAWVDRRLVIAVGDRVIEIDPVTGTIAQGMDGPDGPVDAVTSVATGPAAPGPAVLWGVTGIEARAGEVYVSRAEDLALVPPGGGPLTTTPLDGTVTDMVATDGWAWLALTGDDGYRLERWNGGSDDPPVVVADLPSPAVDLATDGTRVAALLQDGTLWFDGDLLDAVSGVGVEIVVGRPWVLDADGRAVAVDPATGGRSDVATFSFGSAVDTAASGGRFWVLDDAGRVLAERPDGLFHYRSSNLAGGARALVVDGDRVLAAGTDGDVWAFHPSDPLRIVARLSLAPGDAPAVDLAVVGDEVWFVTAAGQLRSEPLTSG